MEAARGWEGPLTSENQVDPEDFFSAFQNYVSSYTLGYKLFLKDLDLFVRRLGPEPRLSRRYFSFLTFPHNLTSLSSMTSRSTTLLQNVPTITTTRQRSKRRSGETPYPVKYSRQMADLYLLTSLLLNFLLLTFLLSSDIWDHMFLTNYLGSLTIHRFPTPPSVVLDLGCGSGYWVIEAAKQWKARSFISCN